VGKLIYFNIKIPDLSYLVEIVSQLMQNPHIDHHNVVIHILKNVNGNPRQELLYENKENTRVKRYCGAGWAGCPFDKISTTQYCIFLGGNLVSWKSKK